MKKISILFLLAISSIIFILSCKKDDDTVVKNMVILDDDGHVYDINTSTGALTLLDSITLGGSNLSGLRDIEYDEANNMLYACLDNSGAGKLLKVNTDTKVATVIESNSSNNRYGISELLIYNNKVYGSTWGKDVAPVVRDPSLFEFNSNGTFSQQLVFANDDLCCGMGLEFKDASTFYIGSENNIYIGNFSGILTDTLSLTLVGFSNSNTGWGTGDYVGIASIVKDGSGQYYCTVYNWDSPNEELYFAKVSFSSTTATLTYIATLSSDDTHKYKGLNYLPESIFK
ncbi:MAG: hypothetical protein H6553_04190 [Chitinophagales bacterium]|nr:hypothetical protein [Chitinophagales bacterium]